ncbi:cutinase family protein [Nocardia sp. NPDC003482]
MKALGLLSTTVAASCGVALVGLGSTAAQAVPIGPDCPPLYVLGVEGTGLSSQGADPLADTGVVGALVRPVVATLPDLVQRSYIPYDAAFGGAVPGGGTAPYVVSVTGAIERLNAAAADVAAACPNTLLAVAGYSQGAQAVSEFARAVGAGEGPVPADRVAGIALYSNPERLPGTGVFPGRPGQTAPDPAPGTDGAAVSTVQMVTPLAAGSGIAADGVGYGALTGRVADICVDGDLSCSAPDHASALRLGAEIAAQADLRDPIAALGSIQALLSATLGEAWTAVLANDFRIEAGAVDYQAQASLSQRLLTAADPQVSAPSGDDITRAAQRWADIVSVVTTNPLVVTRLAAQLAAAWDQLAADNSALADPSMWVRLAGVVARHTGYATTGQLASGTAWFIALAHDAGGRTR